jgi:hypothetical protein
MAADSSLLNARGAHSYDSDMQKRSIIPRGLSSFGGYGLLVKDCPSGTTKCGNNNCCPDGYTCDASSALSIHGGVPVFCCPNGKYLFSPSLYSTASVMVNGILD